MTKCSVLVLTLAILAGAGCSRREREAPRPAPTRPVIAPPAPSPTPPPAFDPVRAKLLTDTGRFFAGLPVDDGLLATAEASQAYKAHEKAIRGLWNQHEKARLGKVRLWAKEHLSELDASSPTLFYPFSGPDCLYPLAFFPSAKRIVFIGLEPVGTVPDPAGRPEAETASDLKEMESYVKTILQISFFRTVEMSSELSEKGVLPILMVFLAGTEHEILDVRLVTLGPDGSVQPREAGSEKGLRGVRLLFRRAGETAPRELLYLSADLSDKGLKKRPELPAFVASLGENVTFLKAASYLMYKPYFSTIRGLILDHASAVLQDDSGVPYRFFGPERWRCSFYGSYKKPIRLFRVWAQPDLKAAFAGPPPAEPLPFGIG
jgi:hypothetical protein